MTDTQPARRRGPGRPRGPNYRPPVPPVVRNGDGVLMLGRAPGGTLHAVAGTAAACCRTLTLAPSFRLDTADPARLCGRAACALHWQSAPDGKPPRRRTPPPVEPLLGRSPSGVSYHAVADGAAVCSPTVAVRVMRRLSQVPADRRCERLPCRRRWDTTTAAPAGLPPSPPTSAIEYVCPACLCERDQHARPCPSCGSPYAALPASAIT